MQWNNFYQHDSPIEEDNEGLAIFSSDLWVLNIISQNVDLKAYEFLVCKCTESDDDDSSGSDDNDESTNVRSQPFAGWMSYQG